MSRTPLAPTSRPSGRPENCLTCAASPKGQKDSKMPSTGRPIFASAVVACSRRVAAGRSGRVSFKGPNLGCTRAIAVIL